MNITTDEADEIVDNQKVEKNTLTKHHKILFRARKIVKVDPSLKHSLVLSTMIV